MKSTLHNVFIGTDVVSVQRIATLLETYPQRFKHHIFTDREVAYCEAQATPPIHYTGRFAAKEAVKKALLSSEKYVNIPLREIEVVNRDAGAPQVNLLSNNSSNVVCKVSISHTDEIAIAFAMIEII
jgi:holo-[acyl-carrier protein] synthase